MTKFYAKKKPGMVRAKSGKYYYPKKKKQIQKQKRWNKRVRVQRDPFPLITRRRLTYAFRSTVTPPTTTLGGFSIDKQTFHLSSLYDPDKSALVSGATGVNVKSSRINHQPMGFDQIMGLYQKYLVSYARLNVNFAFEHPTTFITDNEAGSGTTTGTRRDNTPCRVGVLTADQDDLPQSILTHNNVTPTFEKMLEQAKSGQLNPKASQFRYRTLMKDKVVNMKMNVNPYKFIKSKNNISYQDYKAENARVANQEPVRDAVYAHCFVSPISTVSGDQHTPVVVYGTIDFDVIFSDLISLGQS